MTTANWKIALDTTYSAGRNLSGVGIYSREIAIELARTYPDTKFLHCYRPHRLLRDHTVDRLPNIHNRLLWNGFPHSVQLFHGLNQRLDRRYRRAVTTFHDLFVLTAEYSTADFRARFAAQARDAAARSDLIICVSQFTANQVVELLKVEPSRIRVIPHGVRPPPVTSDVAREAMILFVGAIQKRKNVKRLVEAFERTPADWKLVLAGSRGYGADDILLRVEQSPRRADITVKGYVSDHDLEILYRRASIFAFPSLDEGFGIPVLEAMARCLPVLTSDRSALPEVAGDSAVLVDPQDNGAIAEGLNRLISGGTLRKELSQKGKKRAAAYTWNRAAKATWDVYRELLD